MIGIKPILKGLWFDVEKKNYTTKENADGGGQGCGLM